MESKIIWAITVLTLAGVLSTVSTATTSYSEGTSGNLRQINKEKIVDAGIFRNIFIRSGIPNVQILQGKSNQIKMHLKGRASSTYADKVALKVVSKGNGIH